MDLSARTIHEKQFHDAWRGYAQEEVDDFLDRVAEAVDHLQRENRALQNRLRELDQAVSTSRDTEEMLKKTLVTAQRASEEAIASAKAKAEQLITEAEQRVTRANEEARTRLASLEDELRRKSLDADRDHALKRRDLDASIERLKAFEAELKQRLRLFLDQQSKALNALVEDRTRHAEPSQERVPGDRVDTVPSTQAAPAGVSGAARTQGSPAATPQAGEGPRPGQPAARPSGTGPGPGASQGSTGEVDLTEDVAEAAPRRGLRGLFWGDET